MNVSWNGFLASLAITLLLAWAPPALAGETYLSATIGSYHFNRDRDYEEHNWGLGIEQHSDRWAVLLGAYRNSYRRGSAYALAAYTPFDVGDWRVGPVAGMVTGYDESGPSLFAGGVMTRTWQTVGVNIIFTTSAVALQVKVRIR